MGRYAMFLRGLSKDGGGVMDELLGRIEGCTQVRNCLAHTYGLQTSPVLAAELLGFVEQLLKQDGTTVAAGMLHLYQADRICSQRQRDWLAGQQ